MAEAAPPRIPRFSCAETSAALQEPCFGTASQVRRWLLVEQPGAWGADAVLDSGLPTEVAARLQAVARASGVRLLLIRRHGRSVPAPRACFAVTSTFDVRRVERVPFDDPAELLEVDWSRLAALEPVGGELQDEPLYLVCTNGSHDTCCARFGRPVAKALDEVVGEQVWESSHFGGDRFAGNLVCLPDGIYYGRVGAGDARRLIELHRNGRLDLDHLRGRSFQPFVAQAAEHFTRVEHGLTHVDQVVARDTHQIDDGLFRVQLAVTAGPVLTATVASSPAVDPQQLTCRSSTAEHPPRYRLVHLAERG